MKTTKGTPARATASSAATISAIPAPAGRPVVRATAVVMPCTAVAAAGMSIAGSSSQRREAGSTDPSGPTQTSAALTTRAASGSTPVVSRSKPTSGPFQSIPTEATGR